ncbi:MAG TPA: hypothetical protein VK607_16475, partial [Kofleriaceae bacterium]|nr:hypothetical protein [Kofleriaceae bacterium]
FDAVICALRDDSRSPARDRGSCDILLAQRTPARLIADQCRVLGEHTDCHLRLVKHNLAQYVLMPLIATLIVQPMCSGVEQVMARPSRGRAAESSRNTALSAGSSRPQPRSRARPPLPPGGGVIAQPRAVLRTRTILPAPVPMRGQ